ncbi:MAG: hypothetical protein V4727_12675 [Verrucomicrobiota bacterium]
MFHFVQLALRLVIFLILLAASWVAVVKRTGKQKFTDTVCLKLAEKFSANEIEIRGVSRERGKFTIHRLAMFNEESSFFRGLEFANLVCQRDFFVDFGKTWKPGIVEISKVNLSLRAGADSDEGAQAIGDVLFQDLGSLKPDAIHVANMSMRWGYTERSRGSINESQMKAVPVAGGWRLSFRGGTFSQNWLKRLQIEELDVVITREGIRFDNAVFSKNGGSMVLEQFEVVAGQRPEVSGQMKIKAMNISSMLPMVARAYVSGKISGEFIVSGSTNSTGGIGFDGEVSLQDGDVITLRDRLPLLRAMSAVDSNHDYRHVDFRVGSFQMEMKGQGLKLSDVKLFADDTMSLTGELFIRKPKSDEELVLDDGSEFFGEIVTADESGEDVDISLREAGEVSNRNEFGFEVEGDKSLFGKLAVLRENRRMREFESEKLSRSYRYEGEFNVTLMKTAFDRSPTLKAVYPAATEAGRIPITVPIKGLLYEVTGDLANEIYEKGGR